MASAIPPVYNLKIHDLPKAHTTALTAMARAQTFMDLCHDSAPGKGQAILRRDIAAGSYDDMLKADRASAAIERLSATPTDTPEVDHNDVTLILEAAIQRRGWATHSDVWTAAGIPPNTGGGMTRARNQRRMSYPQFFIVLTIAVGDK